MFDPYPLINILLNIQKARFKSRMFRSLGDLYANMKSGILAHAPGSLSLPTLGSPPTP